MVAALALTKVLNRCYGLEAQIKWPNDVLVAGKKVCGILTEMQSETDWSRFIIIGMGINANHTSEDLAGPFRYPATSLALELGSPIGRRKLFTETLKEFETSFDRFTAEGFPAILKDYEAASAIVNKKVVIHCGSQQKHGRAVGFTPDGGLRLLITDEIEEWVWVGDVTLVEGAV
jgi:BirA family biotin operon repressor/biotin-[acetyl-CoA-carboxylase] ligase